MDPDAYLEYAAYAERRVAGAYAVLSASPFAPFEPTDSSTRSAASFSALRTRSLPHPSTHLAPGPRVVAKRAASLPAALEDVRDAEALWSRATSLLINLGEQG